MGASGEAALVVEVTGVGGGASGADGRAGVSRCRQWWCQMGGGKGEWQGGRVGTGQGRSNREVPPGYAPGTSGKQGEARREGMEEQGGTTKGGKKRAILSQYRILAANKTTD